MINTESKVIRNPQTAYRNIEGEGLVMNPADSMLHSLNEVACAIWEFIAEERKVADVVAMLTDKFDCDTATAERDALAFLEELNKQGLVKVA